MKVQQSLQSCASPPTAQKRSPSPSPVAVINYKPMSQSENSKPQSLQQVNVEPILKNVSPTLPYSVNNCNEQQQINFMEGAKVKEDAQVIDNPQTMKHNIKLDDKSTIDDRPFDPNLVCLRCRKQFRIGEIQEYRKHYEDCQIKQNGQPIQMDPVIPVEHTVSMLITVAYIASYMYNGDWCTCIYMCIFIGKYTHAHKMHTQYHACMPRWVEIYQSLSSFQFSINTRPV